MRFMVYRTSALENKHKWWLQTHRYSTEMNFEERWKNYSICPPTRQYSWWYKWRQKNRQCICNFPIHSFTFVGILCCTRKMWGVSFHTFYFKLILIIFKKGIWSSKKLVSLFNSIQAVEPVFTVRKNLASVVCFIHINLFHSLSLSEMDFKLENWNSGVLNTFTVTRASMWVPGALLTKPFLLL